MHRFLFFYFSIFFTLQACATDMEHSKITTEFLAELPMAISNNAVASAEVSGETRLYSFLGLESGKEWSDVSKKAFRYVNSTWKQIEDVPVEQGRLASIAVTVANQIYLFGGYTVAEDHSEVSTPEVLRFKPIDETYTRVADIPIPSDDAVAFVYQDRYIYLISGWHDKGNINLVQVYDVKLDVWKQATQFPGSPVFGHAGGIVGKQMIVCDGVKIAYPKVSAGVEARREFLMSDECYKGRIDQKDPYRIHWSVLETHPGVARYRVAATGDVENNRILFVGGSDNPYNYNGIGYNNEPSGPIASVFAYDLTNDAWKELGMVNNATMDHRGLLKLQEVFITIGGMNENQEILSKTHAITLSENK